MSLISLINLLIRPFCIRRSLFVSLDSLRLDTASVLFSRIVRIYALSRERVANASFSKSPLQSFDNSFKCFEVSCRIFHSLSVIELLACFEMAFPILLSEDCLVKHILNLRPSPCVWPSGDRFCFSVHLCHVFACEGHCFISVTVQIPTLTVAYIRLYGYCRNYVIYEQGPPFSGRLSSALSF